MHGMLNLETSLLLFILLCHCFIVIIIFGGVHVMFSYQRALFCHKAD